ncbi:unnamed protein product [Scytosiphon promiscuus]
MDRFASMHDEDIDKLGIPNQLKIRDGGWGGYARRSRKRARELSELKGRLERASEKEQQSWNLLKQAVEKGGGAAADEGRFKATGTNRAAEEMRERTVGLVTAEEFRKAREAADALEEVETKKRREKEVRTTGSMQAPGLHDRAATRALRVFGSRDRKRTVMVGCNDEKRERREEESGGSAGAQRPETAALPSEKPDPSCGETGKDGEGSPPIEGDKAGKEGHSSGAEKEGRSLKGAAPDEDNSSAAAMLRARLGQRDSSPPS